MFVGSLFSLTIAADRYYTAIATARKYTAETLPEVEFVSAGIPTVSLVCGTIGVLSLIHI